MKNAHTFSSRDREYKCLPPTSSPPHMCMYTVHVYNDQDVKGPAQTCYTGPGRYRCPIGPTHLHLEAQHVRDAVSGLSDV